MNSNFILFCYLFAMLIHLNFFSIFIANFFSTLIINYTFCFYIFPFVTFEFHFEAKFINFYLWYNFHDFLDQLRVDCSFHLLMS
jgi:hypothetical protein